MNFTANIREFPAKVKEKIKELPQKIKDLPKRIFSGERKKRSKLDTGGFTPLTVVLFVMLILYVISLLTPLIWAFITSFKAQRDFRINIIGLPKQWVWNFETVFKQFTVRVNTAEGTVKVGMAQMFLYSVLYAVGCAFFNTLVPCTTAYCCARFKYRFSNLIYAIVIITMTLPIVGSLPAEIRMAKAIGLYDHIWGLWLMKANFLGMYFLVFYSAFKGLPAGFREAAKIDGAGNGRIFLNVEFPVIKGAFFTVMLINFIGFWNDYQTPLIYLPSYPTVALGMYHMANTTENSLSTVPMRMAGAMLLLIPILIIFLIFHKRLMNNLTMGGLKG